MTNGGAKVTHIHLLRLKQNLPLNAGYILGVDFAGVDLLFGEDGPLLGEVNSNSHLLNIFHCTGINIADGCSIIY